MNPDSVPPVTVTSLAVKLVEGLLRANEIRAVSPARSVGRDEVIVTVGRTVSITIAGVRLPARFGLPTASVKVPVAIVTAPGVVEATNGVKIAV